MSGLCSTKKKIVARHELGWPSRRRGSRPTSISHSIPQKAATSTWQTIHEHASHRWWRSSHPSHLSPWISCPGTATEWVARCLHHGRSAWQGSAWPRTESRSSANTCPEKPSGYRPLDKTREAPHETNNRGISRARDGNCHNGRAGPGVHIMRARQRCADLDKLDGGCLSHLDGIRSGTQPNLLGSGVPPDGYARDQRFLRAIRQCQRPMVWRDVLCDNLDNQLA